jgi:nicotinamide-nucleotide amidase
MTGPDPEALAGDVMRRLTTAGESLAVAESLTGGMVLAALTAVRGASEVLRGGVVAYALDVKHALLGVDERLLEETVAVDARVALAMAEGVRRSLGATYAVATTGEAGPDSASGQPVGSVYVAAVGPNGVDERYLLLPGDRWAIRAATVVAALEALAAVVPD